ncbi:HNH endonuclease [Saccharothrix sp. BKS2]|uniref:HNH endonuclease n=1 Tax=Saccharothrix sp. BKS2 TaxID=3064400 RepID=UPI0039ECF990
MIKHASRRIRTKRTRWSRHPAVPFIFSNQQEPEMDRCIFCKNSSTGSRSVEHVVPQALGNTTQTLPRGVVCDKCNNYFAVKIEKPFLESETVLPLRHHQKVPNKKGRVPSLDVSFGPDMPARLHTFPRLPFAGIVEISPSGLIAVKKSGSKVLNAPAARDEWPEYVVSRFMAKAAVESLAARAETQPQLLDSLVDDVPLEPLRKYARYGEGPLWPHRSRRIHSCCLSWKLPDQSIVQRIWESDLFYTDDDHLHYTLSIFGLELTIDMNARSTASYSDWLRDNNDTSPLFDEQYRNSPTNGIPVCDYCDAELASPATGCPCGATATHDASSRSAAQNGAHHCTPGRGSQLLLVVRESI